MRRGVVAVLLVCAWAVASSVAMADDDRGERDEKKVKIKIRDDCDPRDPAWDATGGCTLRKGVVTEREFGQLLFSPLSEPSIIGHPAWWMDPTYFKVESDERIRVKNVGGRAHTFTEVENFGGGFVPPLNGSLIVAPECAAAASSPPVAPGASLKLKGLTPGNHLLQCCIHPWMRTLIKVEPEEPDEHDDNHED